MKNTKNTNKVNNITETITSDIWDGDRIIAVKINDILTIKVNPFPLIEEKIAFIKKVVDESFVGETDVYFVRTKALFDVLYLLMFTDYTFPDIVKTDDGKIDIDTAYNHIKDLNLEAVFKQSNSALDTLSTELWKDVKQCIDNEKAKRIALLSRNFETEEAITNLNAAVNSIVNFFNHLPAQVSDTNPEALSNVINLIKSENPQAAQDGV
jgi:hypothetical protein